MKTIVIVGPTAVGKTDFSLELATQLNGEIINADSMQLYRGMDIGTAKVPVEERRGITHHLLDVLDVTQTANVATYQREGRTAVHDIQARGKRAIIVGGSGLFVNALLDDMQFPSNDPELRERLYKELEEQGIKAMYQRLVDFDAEAASQVLPTNERRIIRALEVIELTGEAPNTSLPELTEIVPSIRIGLKRDRADLDERINQRVDLMWEQGLVAEVQQLEKLGLREGLTASKALGYQQVLAALEGTMTMDQAIEDTKTGTRRFARRQESWFNRDKKIQWFDTSAVSAEELIAQHSLL
jgi:tRNA dimethylallyltransferase